MIRGAGDVDATDGQVPVKCCLASLCPLTAHRKHLYCSLSPFTSETNVTFASSSLAFRQRGCAVITPVELVSSCVLLYSTLKLLYSTLLYSTLLYSTLLYSTPLHSTPLHSTPLHSTPLHSTPLHSTPPYLTLPYSTPLYSTLLYSTLLYPTH